VAFEIARGICDRIAIAVPVAHSLILSSLEGEMSFLAVSSFGIISSSGISDQIVMFRRQFEFLVLFVG
jgi:hypothetical protein